MDKKSARRLGALIDGLCDGSYVVDEVIAPVMYAHTGPSQTSFGEEFRLVLVKAATR